MNNNEFFKYVLHFFGLTKSPELIQAIFKRGGIGDVSKSQIKTWRTDRDSHRATPMPDRLLQSFLNGLMEYRNECHRKGKPLINYPVESVQKAKTD